MQAEDNASSPIAVTRPGPGGSGGMLLGALGIVIFSGSFPATKLAVADLDPWFVAFGRASVAAALSAVVLVAVRAPLPTAAQWRRLAVVAGGVVVAFPLFSSLALVTSDASHGAVVIAVLPAATAVAAVLRAGERPSVGFWLAAGGGLAIVAAFTLGLSSGSAGAADLLLLASVAACGLGYAEGAVVARELGGARTICWALVLAAPLSVAVAATAAVTAGLGAQPSAWLGFAYVSAFWMFLGFFAWYAGLARGSVARTSQLQLAQPILTLGWSAALLGERIGPGTLLAAGAVLVSVALTQRARVSHTLPPHARPERVRRQELPARGVRGGAREDPRVRVRRR